MVLGVYAVSRPATKEDSMLVNRVVFLTGSLLLALCLTGGAAHPQEAGGQPEISTAKLVNTMRFLGTVQMAYRGDNNRLADQQELLAFIRQRNLLGKSPLDLENPAPYKVQITTDPGGAHYQMTIRPVINSADKSTWCRTAVFEDDSGVIFLGRAIDCPAEPR
jgi:hypothetical protein